MGGSCDQVRTPAVIIVTARIRQGRNGCRAFRVRQPYMQRELIELFHGHEDEQSDNSKVSYSKTENVCLKRRQLWNVTEDFIKKEQVNLIRKFACRKFQETGCQHDYSGEEHHIPILFVRKAFLAASAAVGLLNQKPIRR